jgi:aryl-alcohol dehydrogenase-like predicted oxidoreductase
MQKTQLETAQLGNTGLEITRVGFGAWAIGGRGGDHGRAALPAHTASTLQTSDFAGMKTVRLTLARRFGTLPGLAA